MRFSLHTLKRGLLFFWALWLSIVFLTNLMDLLRYSGILNQSWTFTSGNLDFMVQTTAIMLVPRPVVLLLFLGVLVWEAASALLLWRAFAAFRGIFAGGLNTVYTAFAVSLALWAAFMIADELFLAYDVEATHMRIFIAQLVTLLALRLLPEEGALG